jgi:hypothetical protein
MGQPRILLQISLFNEEDSHLSHFSYEDMGSLRFSITLLTVQVLFSLLILKSYLISIKDNDRYMTPHILMLASLIC